MSKTINIMKWQIFEDPSDWLCAGISCRSGGVSPEPYQSLNLSFQTEDEPVNVINNRKRLCRELKIPFEHYTCAEQIHGDCIRILKPEKAGSGRMDKESAVPGTDALIIAEPKIMASVFLADCCPIIVADEKRKVAAVIHAGWRGTAISITEKTVSEMVKAFGCNPEDLKAGIGPCIGLCCYEISREVFLELTKDRIYDPIPGIPNGQKAHFDLKEANRQQLINTGLDSKNIEIMDFCTSCHSDLFYSHRKSGGTTGRFSAFVSLLDSD